VIYLTDEVVVHPKLLKAGARLGEGGVSQAFHLYVMGISYARRHLTDGFIPDGFVSSCGVISRSSLVAKALSARGIGLWRKVKGGYVIHDYHVHNPKAATVKEKRELDRQRKARERGGRNDNLSVLDISRTRARASHVPRTTKSTSTDAPRRLALARRQNARPHPVVPEFCTGYASFCTGVTFALACVVMAEALELARTVDQDLTVSTAGEHFKTLCAQRGLAYDSDLVRRAYDAVLVAHVRRRA
jgi:hypothetical protein